MPKLVFDIETVGEDFELMDELTKENLTAWIKREAESEADYDKQLADLKDGLGFSPLTGQIVALGVYDLDRDQGVVYFQAPGDTVSEFSQDNFKFKPMTEREMLESFWDGVLRYNEFISFNGRAFDVPFINARSAINGVAISKDLMSNRYLGSQKFGSVHVDLLEQLSYYGAVRKKGSLHLWCRAFGIKSPKSDGVAGDDVARLFQEKKFADIARYNVGDLIATKELYERWRNYLVVK